MVKIPYNFKAIGERLKQLRKIKGWSARESSKQIGISRASYYNIESGLVDNLKLLTIEKICRTFNISESYLLHGYEKETEKVSEDQPPYGLEDIDIKIIQSMHGMTNDEKRNILQDIEDHKLLKEIKAKRKKAG